MIKGFFKKCDAAEIGVGEMDVAKWLDRLSRIPLQIKFGRGLIIAWPQRMMSIRVVRS